MNNLKNYIKKQKNNTLTILGLLMMGFVLMMYVDGKSDKPKTEETEIQYEVKEDDLNISLENILSQINGAGEVKVLLTYKYGRELVPAYDISEDYSNEGTSEKRKTESKVIMSDKNTPLILKERYPQVEGVLIVAKGGGNENVRNALISAAQALLGVEAHKIEVLEMK
jgi:stage III sporulation protein AG